MVITGIFFRYVFYYHIANGDIRMGASCYGTYCNSINLVNLFIGMIAMAWVTDRIGKKPALLVCMAMSVVTYGSLWFAFSTAPSAYWTLHMPFAWTVVVSVAHPDHRRPHRPVHQYHADDHELDAGRCLRCGPN